MKKSLFSIITMALVVINLILTIVLVFVFVPAINKTSNLVDQICKVVDFDINGGEDGESTVSVSDLDNVQVTWGEDTQATLNLKIDTDNKVHYGVLSVIVSLNKTADDYSSVSDSVTSNMGRINSIIREVVSGYTMADANASTAPIEADILTALQQMFNSEAIYSVSFSQFVVQ